MHLPKLKCSAKWGESKIYKVQLQQLSYLANMTAEKRTEQWLLIVLTPLSFVQWLLRLDRCVPFLVLSFLGDSCFWSEHICNEQNEPQVVSDEEQVLSPSHLGDTGLDFLTLKKIWNVFRRHHRLRDLLVVAFVGVALQQLQCRGERRRRRFRRFRRRRRFLRIGFDQLVQSFRHLCLRLDRVTQKTNLKMLIKNLVEK